MSIEIIAYPVRFHREDYSDPFTLTGPLPQVLGEVLSVSIENYGEIERNEASATAIIIYRKDPA